MRTKVLLTLSIIEVLLFGIYAYSLSPLPTTCAEAEDGAYVKIEGFVESASENSFVINDGTGRVIVLGATFAKGYNVVAEGRVFVRSGTKFLNCDKAEIAAGDSVAVTLKNIAENPNKHIGKIIEVSGRIERASSNWFTLEDEGFEITVLSNAKPDKSAKVKGCFFYDPLDLRYKIRAIDVYVL